MKGLGAKTRMAKLSSLLEGEGTGLSLSGGDSEKPISSIEYNSLDVKQDSLFVAISGFETDGHKYIENAVRNGASAIVVSDNRLADFKGLEASGISVIASGNTRGALSRLSAAYYDYPTSRVPVIGVTGTNGKTSTVYMLEAIFKECGFSPGIIGTVTHRWKDKKINASNTTPESRDLQELFFEMLNDGVDIIIMEVSSHGLKLNRVDDVQYDRAVFTNLTRDHLDLHKDFDDYFNAKLQLYHILEKSSKKNRTGIVNADDAYGKKILSGRGDFSYPLKGYGINTSADYTVLKDSIINTFNGITYILESPTKGMKMELGLSGRFNVYNSLCALAVADSMGIPQDAIQRGISSIKIIPGRFQRRTSSLGFFVVVDYAHTDDAVINLLQSARELNPSRLITIFGCGGDRDRTKRPLMAKAAVTYSDHVIVTNDNPRTEDPVRIIEDIKKGLNGKNYEIIMDREKAIEKAIVMAGKGDLVVIAGKGHEDYQILGKEKIHFDDNEIADKYIRERERVEG